MESDVIIYNHKKILLKKDWKNFLKNSLIIKDNKVIYKLLRTNEEKWYFPKIYVESIHVFRIVYIIYKYYIYT